MGGNKKIISEDLNRFTGSPLDLTEILFARFYKIFVIHFSVSTTAHYTKYLRETGNFALDNVTRLLINICAVDIDMYS